MIVAVAIPAVDRDSVDHALSTRAPTAGAAMYGCIAVETMARMHRSAESYWICWCLALLCLVTFRSHIYADHDLTVLKTSTEYDYHHPFFLFSILMDNDNLYELHAS